LKTFLILQNCEKIRIFLDKFLNQHIKTNNTFNFFFQFYLHKFIEMVQWISFKVNIFLIFDQFHLTNQPLDLWSMVIDLLNL
jgi:hypothetical protein